MRGIKPKHHNVTMYRLEFFFIFFLRNKGGHLIDQPKGHELVPKKIKVLLLAHMHIQRQTGNDKIITMEGLPAPYC